jgi:hypothetical protein
MNPVVKGARKSKTVWLGFIIMLFGYMQANLHTLAPWVDQKYIGLSNMLLGLAVMIVRFYTDQSLADKGSDE